MASLVRLDRSLLVVDLVERLAEVVLGVSNVGSFANAFFSGSTALSKPCGRLLRELEERVTATEVIRGPAVINGGGLRVCLGRVRPVLLLLVQRTECREDLVIRWVERRGLLVLLGRELRILALHGLRVLGELLRVDRALVARRRGRDRA